MITRSKYIIENRVNWTYWAFWYIELQAIFKQCILQTVLNKYFFVYICVTKNLLFQKLSCILHFFDLVFGVTVLKVLCLWCSLYVTGNSGFISYSRYNLLQIVIKITQCEKGGVHLRISVWHLLMNLKNNYLLKKLLSEPIKMLKM